MVANAFALLPLLGAVAAAGLAILTWGRSLAPLAIAVAAWNLAVALLTCATEPTAGLWLVRGALLAITLLGPTTFSFLSAVGRFRRRRGLLAACWVVAAPVALAVLVDPGVVAGVRAPSWGGLYGVAGPRGLAPAIVATTMTVAGLLGIVPEWRRAPPSRRRRQLGWVLASYGSALLGAADVLGLTGHDVPPIGWATSAVTVGMLYYAIARDRLLDVRTALHRTRAWLLFIAATFLPLAAVVFALGDRGGVGARLALLAALVLLARRVERLLRVAFGRRRRRLQRTVQRFVRATRAPSRPSDVLRPLERALADGFGLELAAVAVAIDAGDDGPAQLQVLGGGGAPAPDAPIPAEPLARAELDPEATRAPALRWLDGLGADVVVPMGAGAILARAAPPTRTFDELERQGLVRLAARAEVAFTNGALHEELEAHATRLEADVVARTRSLERALTDVQTAQVRLIQAEKQSALGLLVAGASHEVNNALNFIYGNAPILERYVATYDDIARAAGPVDDAGAAAARARLVAASAAIADAAGRARGLVEDLRRFARPDDRNEPRAVDVAEGLRATCALLAPELRGRAELVLDLAPGCQVLGFPSALNQVFLNVLVNAAQALPDGRGTISVACAPAAGGVDVTVRDDGVGLRPDAAARLFEPFFTTKARAAGLGLTVAREIVSRHGGTIAVAAAEPGTRVAIHLPREGL